MDTLSDDKNAYRGAKFLLLPNADHHPENILVEQSDSAPPSTLDINRNAPPEADLIPDGRNP